jgi:hypothetical protein
VPREKKSNVPPGFVRFMSPILLGVLRKTNSTSLYPNIVGTVHGTRLVHSDVSSKPALEKSEVWPTPGARGTVYIDLEKGASLEDFKIAVAKKAFPGTDFRWANLLCVNRAVQHGTGKEVLTLLLTKTEMNGIRLKKHGMTLPRRGRTSPSEHPRTLKR